MVVHVATTVMKLITPLGTVTDKESASIRTVSEASGEIRVQDDSAIASTSGYPSVKTYIEREAAAGFKLSHMDQTYIITYPA